MDDCSERWVLSALGMPHPGWMASSSVEDIDFDGCTCQLQVYPVNGWPALSYGHFPFLSSKNAARHWPRDEMVKARLSWHRLWWPIWATLALCWSFAEVKSLQAQNNFLQLIGREQDNSLQFVSGLLQLSVIPSIQWLWWSARLKVRAELLSVDNGLK